MIQKVLTSFDSLVNMQNMFANLESRHQIHRKYGIQMWKEG